METVMIKERLPNIHPGKILQEEFLIPLNITPYKIAKEPIFLKRGYQKY